MRKMHRISELHVAEACSMLHGRPEIRCIFLIRMPECLWNSSICRCRWHFGSRWWCSTCQHDRKQDQHQNDDHLKKWKPPIPSDHNSESACCPTQAVISAVPCGIFQ